MTKSSFSNMFNRLPMYSRPKEPAIGYPDLQHSTNPRLVTQHSGLQIVGLDGRPYRSGAFDVQKSLPGLPQLVHSDDAYRPFPLSSATPPPRGPSPYDIHPAERNVHPTEREATPPRVPLKTTAPMKAPAIPTHLPRTPSPDPMAWGTTSTIVGGAQAVNTSQKNPHSKPAKLNRRGSMADMLNVLPAPSQKSHGFGLGSLVKEKVTGRRRNGSISNALDRNTPSPRLDSAGSGNSMENVLDWLDDRRSSEEHDGFELPAETVVLRPAHSIDNWLDQRQDLHKRSNTISTVKSVATRRTTHNDKTGSKKSKKDEREKEERDGMLKLKIRESTFEPLTPPLDTADMPSLPTIPAHFLSSNNMTTPSNFKTSAVPSASAAASPPRRKRTESKPAPPPPAAPAAPRDHLSQLEYDRDQLEGRARELRHEMKALEDVSTPNMKAKMSKIEGELADVERGIHDVGMRLHRAYRKRDEGNSHIWVSRVTAV